MLISVVGGCVYYGPTWQFCALVYLAAVALPALFVWLRHRNWQFPVRALLVSLATIAAILAAIHEDIQHAVEGTLSLRHLPWDIPLLIAPLSAMVTWAIFNRPESEE